MVTLDKFLGSYACLRAISLTIHAKRNTNLGPSNSMINRMQDLRDSTGHYAHKEDTPRPKVGIKNPDPSGIDPRPPH